MKPNPNSTTILRIIFLFSIIGILITFLNSNFTFTVLKLSKPYQSIYALACALICFLASYLSNRREYKKNNQIAAMVSFLPWIGLGEIGVAIFLAFVDRNTKIAHLGDVFNYGLSMLGYTCAYLATFTLLFPQVIRETLPQSPDPLIRLPKNLREIIHDGRNSVDTVTISTLAILIGIVSISIFFLGEMQSPLIFISIEIFVAILIAFITRFLAARRWQKRAMQSGIPERELKSAAKLAHLPWPKIKEE